MTKVASHTERSKDSVRPTAGVGGRIAVLLRAAKSKHAAVEVLLIEVALIVVSVLLALAVNNWNANRQERRLEGRMLQQLRNSLAADLAGLKELDQSVRLRTARMESLRAHLQQGLPYADSLNANFGAVIRFWDYPLNRSPYEVLKVRGLDLVSDDSLRMRIVGLYDRVYVNVEHSEADNRNCVLEVVRPYFLQNFRDIQFGDRATPLNYAVISRDPHFRNVLDYALTCTKVNVLEPTESAIGEINNLIGALDTAIGQQN
jgi:hypothetical protein